MPDLVELKCELDFSTFLWYFMAMQDIRIVFG